MNLFNQQLLSRITLLSVLNTLAGISQAAPIDAGQSLQDIRRTAPPALPQPSSPQINLLAPAPGQPTASSGILIRVKRVQVTGVTRLPAATVANMVQDAIGHDLTLADLHGLAARITRFYRSNGYPVARAYLPPQEIRDGVVTLAVTEGRYGKVNINHSAAPHLPVAQNGPVSSGQVIASAPLERELLLLSDLPGLKVQSTLGPGAAVGTSDLNIDITSDKKISGNAQMDDYGSRFTGQYRAGGTVNLANLAGRGDLFSLQALTAGQGLGYGRLAYQAPVSSNGTLAGVAVSEMHYSLGQEFASLKAAGTANTATVFASYPVIRSRLTNLSVQLNFDNRLMHDHIAATATDTDKHTRVFGLGVNGNHQWESSVTTWAATLAAGHLGINSPGALETDRESARTAGDYAKLELNATHVYLLGEKNTLYLAYRGQLASRNLDSSERFSVGGVYGVRAYSQDEAQADEAHLFSAELRHDLTPKLQIFGLADAGHARLNRNPWPAATGPNEKTLNGIGIGTTWQPDPKFNVKIMYAARVGPERSVADTSRGRLWFQAVRFF